MLAIRVPGRPDGGPCAERGSRAGGDRTGHAAAPARGRGSAVLTRSPALVPGGPLRGGGGLAHASIVKFIKNDKITDSHYEIESNVRPDFFLHLKSHEKYYHYHILH